MLRSIRYPLLVLLTAIAAWLRFTAIGFGLPDQFRPDEEMTVPTALGFEEDWNPHLAIYPAAQTYLIHGALRSYAFLTRSGRDLHLVYGADNDAKAFLIAREISAAMGTATIPVTYYAAAPIFGPEAALASAAIMTVSFIHVRESKSAKVEVPAAFWLALSIAMLLRIAVRGRRLDYALAGWFCGLAAATHYTSGAIAIGIVVAHLEGRKREGKTLSGFLLDPRIYLAGELAILAFISTDPYFILDWKQTSEAYRFMHSVYTGWNGGNSPAGYGWDWLLMRSMPAAFGVVLEVFLMAALVWGLIKPRPGTYALAAFIGVCFLSLTSGRPQLEYRYLINPLMAMAILGGILFSDLMTVEIFPSQGMFGYFIPIAGVLLLMPSLIRSLEVNHLLRQTDTRTIAKYWILDRIPRGSNIVLIDGYTYGKPDIRGRYNLVGIDAATPGPLVAAMKDAKWVIADSFPPLALWSRGAGPEELDELDSRGEVVFDISPLKPGATTPAFDPNDAFYIPFLHITSMMRPGPGIRIWKINPSR